ncbi:endonuclease/exonuclease/phosphatase family protein [Mucilaginibacter sp. AW1-3]
MIKAKPKLSFFDKLVLFTNYGFAFSLLVSYVAPFVSPQTFWPVAFFGLAYPFLLLFSLFFIVYWFFRGKIYMLVSIIAIGIGYKAICANIGFHKPTDDAQKKSAEHIRVMTYNVHDFVSFTFGPRVPTFNDILNIVDTEQPDILCFEEFYNDRTDRFKTPHIRDTICKTLGTDQFFFLAFSRSNTGLFGLSIFSKYPIIDHGFIRLSQNQSDNQCIFIDVKNNNKIFRVYCVHLQSISLEKADYKYLDSVTEKGKTDLHSSKRIGGKLKLAFIKRAEQVFLVKQHASQCQYPYIIAGDFNDTPSSFAVNQMAKGIKNAFTEKGFGLGKTYNGDFPNFQIDYIMPSMQFDVVNYKIIEKKLSDHYAVRSDLVLR